MKCTINMTDTIYCSLLNHLFPGPLEQGVFLFANPVVTGDNLELAVVDMYPVLPEGWLVQDEDYLEMSDKERAKIMKMARDGGFAVIDCHSHPGARDKAWFSPSDRRGITEFAGYAKWKLSGMPFAAMVWGESSVDAVVWHHDFQAAYDVEKVVVAGECQRVLTPRGTWYAPKQEVTYGFGQIFSANPRVR